MVNIELLQQEVDKLEKETVADGSPLFLEHFIIKYDKGNLDLKPKYQRVFRWTREQKSKLIESLILGIPLPSFFVAEDKNGKWEIVDGLQRISTILEFIENDKFLRELSKNPKIKGEDDNSIKKGLSEGQYLNSLEGVTWKDLPERYKNRILDTKIYVSTIKNTGDDRAKFELFQRLNSLGTPLSDQEARNCLLVDKNEAFYDQLILMSERESFKSLIKHVKQERIGAKEGMEFVLRYIALKNISIESFATLSMLLDDIVYSLIGMPTRYYKDLKIDIEKEVNLFNTTFDFICEINENAFNKGTKKQVIYPLYDTISSGIGFNINTGNIDVSNVSHKSIIKEKIKNLANDPKYIEGTKIGKTSEMKLKFSANFGKEYFKI